MFKWSRVFVYLSCALSLRIPSSELRAAQFATEGKPEYVVIEDSPLSFGEGCSDAQRPKVAICVAGLSRSFVEDHITSSFLTHLLIPAGQAGAVGLTRGEPDVFVHIKLGQNDMASALHAVTEIRATNYTIQEGVGDIRDKSELANQTCYQRFTRPVTHSGGSLIGLMGYYKSIYGCYQLVQEVENQVGDKYDVVVMMRPDHQWGENRNHNRHESSGGAPVKKRIQCSKSLFATDMYSFQTRAAFEHYGNIYVDQFLNPNPTACHASQYESLVKNIVEEINKKVPGSAVYSNTILDASKSGIWQDGKVDTAFM